MGKTSIEWCRGPSSDDGSPGDSGMTWGVLRGCSRVSPGCGGGGAFAGPAVAGRAAHGGCYAEGIAARFSGPGMPFEGFAEMTANGPRWTRKVALVPDKLDEPLRRKKPTTWFISMSDLFHEALSDDDIAKVFAVMSLAPRHLFQILTKRSERMTEFVDRGRISDVWHWRDTLLDKGFARYAGQGFARHSERGDPHAPWAETVVEWSPEPPWPLPNVHLGVSVEASPYKGRIDHLRSVPAAVKFISFEPLLEDLGELDLSGIDQAIVGSESGHGARRMHDDWVRNIRDQALAQGVAFFNKQKLDAKGHKVSLPMLDGRQWAEMPERVVSA